MEINKEENEEIKDKDKNNERSFDKIVKRAIICSVIIIVVLMLLFAFIENASSTVNHKPIIYIYPEREQEVEVKLLDKDLLTCSYPKYKSGWNVIAKPNGDLVDLDTKKQLYSLYYEANSKNNFKVEKEGFCVKREDVVSFLEEKLEILGLNYKEKEEFIVYWLPKLEANKYNYIRFATMDEINQNMKLEFSKKPDTLIRVLMTYKGLENPIEVKEQKLETPERKGFVAVEWGGSEIK